MNNEQSFSAGPDILFDGGLCCMGGNVLESYKSNIRLAAMHKAEFSAIAEARTF